LWITSAFVQANGGRFAIASRDDAPGTVASIILPAEALASRSDEALVHD
jgi:hypothetical protein